MTAPLLTKLPSIFHDPRIAAIRPFMEITTDGKLIAAKLDHLPVSLLDDVPDTDAAQGVLAQYDSKNNAMRIPREVLEATSDEARLQLAHVVRHEGMHRIQRGSDANYLGIKLFEPSALAIAGAKAVIDDVLLGSPKGMGNAWNTGVLTRGARGETEAYLTDYRSMVELRTVAVNHGKSLPPLAGDGTFMGDLASLEAQLARPLRADDLAPRVLKEPTYLVSGAMHDLPAARRGVSDILVATGTAAAGATAIGMTVRDANE